MKKTFGKSFCMMVLCVFGCMPVSAQVFETDHLHAKDEIIRAFDYLLPKGMKVKDVVTWNHEVFFCGSFGSDAMFGQLNPNTASIKYVVCDAPYTSLEHYYVHATEFVRMDYSELNDTINLALVGTAFTESSQSQEKDVSVSIRSLKGSSIWYLAYSIDNDEIVFYASTIDSTLPDTLTATFGYQSRQYKLDIFPETLKRICP